MKHERVEAVHWVVVGSGFAAVATAYNLLDVLGGYADDGGWSTLLRVVDVLFYGFVSGTLVYGAVSGYGAEAFGGYFAVAALSFLSRYVGSPTAR